MKYPVVGNWQYFNAIFPRGSVQPGTAVALNHPRIKIWESGRVVLGITAL